MAKYIWLSRTNRTSYSIVYNAADTSLTFTGYRTMPGLTEDITITKIKATGIPV
jgi:hypothetical protein